jgi:hypothetical protein
MSKGGLYLLKCVNSALQRKLLSKAENNNSRFIEFVLSEDSAQIIRCSLTCVSKSILHVAKNS